MSDAQEDSLRPIFRSPLRLAAGKAYYSLRRRLFWAANAPRFASQHEGHWLPRV